MDAIDGALVDFSNNQPALVQYRQTPIDQAIRDELIAIDKNTGIGQIARLDVILGKLFASAAQDLIRSCGVETNQIAAIGCHGQTILHRPEPPEPTTLQIGDPNIICQLTGIPTVADFRRMDLAAGGQGAPLAPLFHQAMFSHPTEARVVLNIGGMGNITILPATESGLPATGFDTGPGNVLLDGWVKQHTGQAIDTGGSWAASGELHKKLLAHLLDDQYFRLPPPKSTGRDYFNPGWLKTKLDTFNQFVDPRDVQATLTELTAVSIAASIENSAPETQTVIVCGGGVHNGFLLRTLARTVPGRRVCGSGDFGIDPDAVEAMTFALLAHNRVEGRPGNIPTVTGAASPAILGAIYRPACRR